MSEVSMSDQQLLVHTQAMRLRLIDALAPVGAQITTDPKEAKVLLTALKDMDSQVLTKMRQAAEDKNAEEDRKAALLIAKTSEHLARLGNHPFKASAPVNRALPNPADVPLPDIDVVEGELDVGRSTETYDDFMKRVEEA